jgi:ketosteroid isomerase-like protein
VNDGIAVVQALLDALDAGDEARIRDLVAPDFSTVPVSTGVPMGLEEWLRSHAQVAAAFPGLRRNPTDFEQEGDTVFVTLHIAVLNDHPVRIPALGIEELPPTGRVLRPTPHRDTFTLRDGKVVSVHSDMPPGGGLKGMLDQIRGFAEEDAAL